jgi:hypothetical protein
LRNINQVYQALEPLALTVEDKSSVVPTAEVVVVNVDVVLLDSDMTLGVISPIRALISVDCSFLK